MHREKKLRSFERNSCFLRFLMLCAFENEFDYQLAVFCDMLSGESFKKNSLKRQKKHIVKIFTKGKKNT